MKRLISAAGLAALAGTAPAQAGDPPPFEDFTFKRIKAPEEGEPPRITVQIAPKPEPAAPEPESSKPQPPNPPGGSHAWFWETVPAAGAGQAGLETALATLRNAVGAQGIRPPRLARLRTIADRYGKAILKATVGTHVSPALALAVIAVESGGRPAAVSTAGAEGLMQLMPATAKRFGVSDSMAAGDNIRGGVAYLDWLMGEFGNDPILTLAGYNAGEGAVRDHGGVPPYAETRGYVPKVLAAFSVARGLCITPPVLVSDGCVFVGGGG